MRGGRAPRTPHDSVAAATHAIAWRVFRPQQYLARIWTRVESRQQFAVRCPARQGASSSDPRPCHFRMGRRTDYARTGQSSLPGVSGSSCARRNVFALNGLFTPILHRRATGAPPAGQHRTRRPPRPGGSLLLRSSRRIRRSREDFCRARFDSSTRYFVQLFVQLVSDCGLGRRI